MNSEEMASRISRIETMWTLVRDAHAQGEAQIAQAQEAILQRYTGAIYRYLVAVMRDPNAADEVFQEFAVKFLRGAFRNADPGRGRFRDLVKKALWNLIHDHRNKQRKAPGGIEAESAIASPEVDTTPES